jgi:glycosyltransferase involved in cell wall biosynthesis
MKPLHLSTGDASGGAARAAFRVHTGLRSLGVDSSMLVLKRTTGDPAVHKLKFATDLVTRFKRSRRAKRIERDFAPYKTTLPPDFEWFSDDRTECGYDLIRQLPPCDLINLHWVSEFVDYELLFPRLPPKVPLVWRLADMGALTGGCHYDNGCGKFTARCGACPVLGSTKPNDLSRQVWRRRQKALGSIPDSRLTLVATSGWIAAESRRSSLLSRFPVVIIPNSVETDVFVPAGKNASRDRFGIPRDKTVILFIADSVDNKRKGFDHLVKALTGITGRADLLLVSIGNKKPDVPGLPLIHLGRITDDPALAAAYAAADLFVIPSIQESFGQTVIESMACGTPVVGFDTGGIPDMVRPGITGSLAKVGDADDLRAKIVDLLDDPQRRAAMAIRCREIAVAEYAQPVQAAAYRRLYETILNKAADVIGGPKN